MNSKPDVQTRTCDLYDNIPKVWKSKKYKNKAKDAVSKLPNALKAILQKKGGPTGR